MDLCDILTTTYDIAELDTNGEEVRGLGFADWWARPATIHTRHRVEVPLMPGSVGNSQSKVEGGRDNHAKRARHNGLK